MKWDTSCRRSIFAFAGIAVLLAAGCAGIQTAATGVGLLVLSPLMIAGGVAEGLACLPYTFATDIHTLNRGLIEAQATNLDEAYRSTYGVSIHDRRVDPQSGAVRGEARPFHNMLEATRALQKLLVEKGMDPARASHYILCSIDSHTRSRGHILLSVVYRHAGMNPIRVIHKQTGIESTLRPDQSAWREPYARSADGVTIDEVVDFGGMEDGLLESHKTVGMLMVTAVESIQSSKRSDAYWEIERRWMSGETGEIIAETKQRGLEAIHSKG